MSSQGPWISFICCVLIASFVGGAVRLFFSTESIRQAVKEYVEREKPPFELVVESINVSLSKGLWPRLGVEVRNLQIFSLDPCTLGVKLHVEQAYLPVSLLSLLGRQLKFGKVWATDVQLDRLSCSHGGVVGESDGKLGEAVVGKSVGEPSGDLIEAPSSLLSSQESENQKDQEDQENRWVQREIKRVQAFMKQRWALEIRRFSRWMRGLNVENLRISHGGKHLIQVEEISTYLPSNGERLIIESSWRPLEEWVKGLDFIQMRWEIDSITQQLFATVRIKEGRIRLNARTNIENLHFDTDIDVRHLPLKAIGQTFGKYSYVKLGFQPKMFWLNCQGRWGGLLSHWKESRIKTTSCQFVGAKGRVYFSDLDIRPWQKPVIRKMSMRISDLSMRKVFKSLTGFKVQGFFNNDFGILNGKVDFLPKTGWEGSLNFKDMSLIFSRGGKRRSQRIHEIQLGGSYKKGRGLLARVNYIQIENGTFYGDVVLYLDEYLQDGLFHTKIKALNFAPEIQELMVGHSLAPLYLDLSVRISQGSWQAWEVEVGSNQVHGQYFGVNGIHFRGRLKKEILEGKVRIQKSSFTSKHPYFPWLMPLFLGQKKEKGSEENRVVFKDVVATLLIHKGGGAWELASGREWNDSFTFTSSGHWQRQGNLGGKVIIKNSEYPHLIWDVVGRVRSPTLWPQSQVVSTLSQGRVTEEMSPRDRLEYVKKFGEKRRGEGN